MFGKQSERIAVALESIADSLAKLAPKTARVMVDQRIEVLPSLGITASDPEDIVKRELEEEAKLLSHTEKLMKEEKEFREWKERNLNKRE